MNTLEKMLLVLGFMVALIGLVIIFGLVLAACSCILDKWHSKGMQAQWEKDRGLLIHYSYWFEDEPTRLLIQDLAKGGTDIGKIRDDWRNRREIQSVERGTV